jgi:hypothetical protein
MEPPPDTRGPVRKPSPEDFRLPRRQNSPRKGEKNPPRRERGPADNGAVAGPGAGRDLLVHQIGARMPFGDPRARQQSWITRVGYEVG